MWIFNYSLLIHYRKIVVYLFIGGGCKFLEREHDFQKLSHLLNLSPVKIHFILIMTNILLISS